MFITKQDVVLDSKSWGQKIQVPANVRLVEMKNGEGNKCYAVADRATTARLTGDEYRSKYYYLWIPNDLVKEI